MFTIIVATHDRPLLLRRTLHSLIAQTWKDFHVIVVDDAAGSIPPFEEMNAMQGCCTYIIRSGLNGPAESRNIAIELVKTAYVIFLDDDDTFEPGHLAALAAQIGSGPPELLFCDFSVVNEDRRQTPPARLSSERISVAAITAQSVHVINRIPNSCVVYRRDVVADVRFATDMNLYEDWDFLLQCLKGRMLRHVPVGSVNIHKSKPDAPQNMRRGNSRKDLILDTMKILYKKHAAPSMQVRLQRQALMAQSGVVLPLEEC